MNTLKRISQQLDRINDILFNLSLVKFRATVNVCSLERDLVELEQTKDDYNILYYTYLYYKTLWCLDNTKSDLEYSEYCITRAEILKKKLYTKYHKELDVVCGI